MSNSWSWFVIIGVVTNIVAVAWLLFVTSNKTAEDEQDDGTTGHEWDGIKELNNPLPRWWFHLFIITIVFSVIYLVLYPGLGNFSGVLGWSQAQAYEENLEQSRTAFAQAFIAYREMPEIELSQNSTAMQTGARLYANYCSACHGSDARGSRGFPNLTDNDWLYGGDPEHIKHSIIHGRTGIMPPMAMAIGGEDGVLNVAAYLSNANEYPERAEKGKVLFDTACVACHGPTGEGNPMLGAPNLRDDIWLHGEGLAAISDIVTNGKQSRMPAHQNLLSDDEIHLLTAYVYSLSKSVNMSP